MQRSDLSVFPRNEAPNPAKYLGERPEMTTHDEESKKAKTKLKQKETTTMKTKLTKIIMSSLAFACALVCLVAIMAPGTSATARAAADGRVCSEGMLKGLYLLTIDGGYTKIGENLLPTAVMEGKRFNGDGTFINDFGTVNIGGSIIIDSGGLGGTYTVAPDCTGTLSVPGGPSFNMYVGPGAQKVWINLTAGGATGVGLGTMTRQPGQ
jgi:hypothetical protein